MLRVGSSGKIRACGKGPDNTVRNNCHAKKGSSLLTSNFPNFSHHHFRHQHVMVNHQLPGSLFELPPKLSMLFWPEAAFHFALKGRGRVVGGASGGGAAGPQKSSPFLPPCAAGRTFVCADEGRERAGETTATVPPNAELLLSPTPGVNSSRK